MGKDDLKIDRFRQILSRKKLIYCDSVIFSYHFHQHLLYSPLTAFLFDLLTDEKITIITSCLSYMEILSLKALEGEENKRLLIKEFFLSQNNLRVESMDFVVSEQAAYFHRTTGLKSVDAIHLATALKTEADMFLTNDKDFRRISPKQLSLVILDEFIKE